VWALLVGQRKSAELTGPLLYGRGSDLFHCSAAALFNATSTDRARLDSHHEKVQELWQSSGAEQILTGSRETRVVDRLCSLGDVWRVALQQKCGGDASFEGITITQDTR
jgi:hypothetical protein